MKCLCKNGQNGDPWWKKSCSWSFQDAPWSASDVKSVQCKARTVSTTTTTTTTTTTSTTTQANPNTEYRCLVRDTWKPCSNCYTYVQTHDYYYSFEVYETYEEEHTCTYSISKKCNPNFVDKRGFNCKSYTNTWGCLSGGRSWYLKHGIMTEDGFMTALNCPQCGCTEEDGPFRPDFATLSDF